MLSISTDEWFKRLSKRGVSKDLIARYFPYAQKLGESNSPVIFELEHLSRLVGIEYDSLRGMISGTENFYRTFNIKKRSGGTRKIEAPYPSLLLCQDWIYRNILINKPVHESAHGYVPRRSIFSNASVHLGARCLLKMDLRDFFPSIKINWVINYFSGLGYADNVAFYLAALCCCDGRLVQGASTSPYLTNILLVGLDRRLSAISKKYGLNYTRYADDLTFSGEYISHRVIGIVSSIVDEYGLSVNEAKTRLQIDKNQKIVTGLSVAGDKLTVPRQYKRKLKQELFYIKKYGYSSHVAKVRQRNPFYVESLLGKLYFWLQAEPDSREAKNGIDLILVQ
ncbi:reverse transcriptase family protein [Pseudomonas tohonis]|uniref:reverse transcriptase family protein n=1 Tax=Pseudomonas tohonis TaxID=2725477 RepID=UPI0022F028AD|nr:reverse transcriptase family protein [Pseudomonas tohonis]